MLIVCMCFRLIFVAAIDYKHFYNKKFQIYGMLSYLTEIFPCERVDRSTGILVDDGLCGRSKCSHPAYADHTVVDEIHRDHVCDAFDIALHHTKKTLTRLGRF